MGVDSYCTVSIRHGVVVYYKLWQRKKMSNNNWKQKSALNFFTFWKWDWCTCRDCRLHMAATAAHKLINHKSWVNHTSRLDCWWNNQWARSRERGNGWEFVGKIYFPSSLLNETLQKSKVISESALHLLKHEWIIEKGIYCVDLGTCLLLSDCRRTRKVLDNNQIKKLGRVTNNSQQSTVSSPWLWAIYQELRTSSRVVLSI